MENRKRRFPVVYKLVQSSSATNNVHVETNTVTVKDLRTGQLKNAVLSRKPMVIGSEVSMVFRILPKKGERKVSKSENYRDKYKFLSEENYDPAAVKQYEEETGQLLSPDFRLTIQDNHSLIVTIKDNFDKAAVQNMSDEEQLAVLKGLQLGTRTAAFEPNKP